jgi:hypothetical protein
MRGIIRSETTICGQGGRRIGMKGEIINRELGFSDDDYAGVFDECQILCIWTP